MMTLLFAAGALLFLVLLMTGVLTALMLTHLHRSATPAELACCPMFYGEDGVWEGCA